MAPRITYDKSFSGLLESTAELIVEAHTTPHGPVPQAALLYSTLLLESAANCCIWSLRLPGPFAGDIDKLPTFTKFDLFLLIWSRGKKKLDRGSRSFQDATELKGLRDLAVHPKKSRITWVKWDDDLGGEGVHDATERLKIPRSTAGWGLEQAISAFRTANAFLEDYFLNSCAMSQKQVRMLLLAEDGPDADGTDVFLASRELDFVAKNLGIPLRYISIRGKRKNN
jgi:hypothetical protein